MKFYFRHLTLLCLFLTLLTPAQSQSWEVFYEDSSFNQVNSVLAYPAPSNGVRVSVSDFYGSTPGTLFSFNETGDYTGQTTLPWTSGWGMINVDNTGASYWLTFYKLRKVSANNQVVWSYVPPVSAGILWEQPLPGGGACLQYYGNNNLGYVIDYVNPAGQLAHRYSFTNNWPDEYHAGYDYSMIYTEDAFSGGDIHWIKKDQNDQIVWEKDLPEENTFLSGSLPDGSTLCFNHSTQIFSKLDAAGNTVWQHSSNYYFPGINYSDLLGLLVRQDGSVIVSFSNSDNFSFQYHLNFINLDLSNGAPIWIKQAVTPVDDYIWMPAPMVEMPDGGILACVGPLWTIDSYDKILLIRTDKDGNTLSNQIAGNIFKDDNQDCTAQSGETPLNLISVIAQSGAKKYSATSAQNGDFGMPATAGDYTISVTQPGDYWNVCSLPNPVHLDSDHDTIHLSIGIQAIVDCPQLELSVGSTVFRRCFDNTLTVQYHNYGTAPAVNAYVTITLPAELIYQSATAPLLNQNGQTFTFDVGTVGVGESGAFYLYFKVDCNADLGEELCVESQIYPDTSCIPTAKDMTSNRFCMPVVASYDPNDKTALVNGKPEMLKILPDKELEYLIRFQNTGNDTAFNIVVTDTLSEQLDAATVVPGAASHPYSFELRNGNVLRFTFNNILLPDSNTNEAASHGFVKFAIRQRPGNAIGTNILNTAAIYFDHNAPVLTNTSKLLVSNSVGTQEAPVLYARTLPVPAHKQVTILLPYAALSWKLLDVNGRVLRTGASAESTFTLQREGLPGGLYWCQCTLANGQTAVSKIVFD